MYTQLDAGDASLVNDIAKALYKEGGGRYTFSFASKFCTYVSQTLYDSDKYCIYDRVVSDVLPYYAWAYWGDDSYFARSKSKISRMFGIDRSEPHSISASFAVPPSIFLQPLYRKYLWKSNVWI